MSEVAAPVSAAPAAAPVNANPTTDNSNSKGLQTAAELFDVVVDGKTEKLTREELIRHASIGKGAHKKFEEAAAMRRDAESLIGDMKDPKKVFKLLQDKRFGLSKEQITASMEEWYRENVIAEAELSPDQKRARDAEERLKAYEEKEKNDAKAEAEKLEQQRDQEEARKLQSEVLDALDKANLPKTRFTANRLAHWMRVNEMKGINAPAELLIEQVRKEAKDIMGSLLESADGDVLVNLVGEKTIKKLRQHDIKALQARRGIRPASEQVKTYEAERNEPMERISVEEMKRRERDPNNWR